MFQLLGAGHRKTLNIKGKGNKVRWIPMNETVQRILSHRRNNNYQYPFNYRPDTVTHKIKKSLLKDEEFLFYDKNVYSIESYLLDADAIGKANGLDNTKIEEIRTRINNDQIKKKADREKPKTLLSNIWFDFGLGNYDDESPEKIAKNMSKLSLLKFPEISEIIDKINGNYTEQ